MALGENQLPNLTRLFAVLGSLLPLAGFADEPPASDDPDAAFDTSDFLLNRQGVYRYLGALAHGRVNLDYYAPLNQGRGYQLKGTMLIQQLLARIGDSRWYVGPRHSYFGSDARFRGEVPGELGSAELGERIGKLAVGIDVAHSKDQNAFYIQVGSAWR